MPIKPEIIFSEKKGISIFICIASSKLKVRKHAHDSCGGWPVRLYCQLLEVDLELIRSLTIYNLREKRRKS